MKLRDGTIWILQPILYPGFQPMASYSTIVKSGLDVGERDLTTLSTDFISKPGNAAYLTNDQTEAIGILKNSYEVSRQQLINNLKVNNSIAKNQMNFALQCNRVRSQHQTKKAKKWHDSPLHASQIGLIDYYLDNRQSILNRNIAWSGAVKIIKNIKALLPENMHTLFPKLNFKLPYRINVEDLSWSKSKSNIPNAERHSQWVRGQLIRYIQELAVLEGIGCMKISARYTSQVCCKCGQLGEKGFLYHNFGMGEILHGSDLIDEVA